MALVAERGAGEIADALHLDRTTFAADANTGPEQVAVLLFFSDAKEQQVSPEEGIDDAAPAGLPHELVRLHRSTNAHAEHARHTRGRRIGWRLRLQPHDERTKRDDSDERSAARQNVYDRVPAQMADDASQTGQQGLDTLADSLLADASEEFRANSAHMEAMRKLRA
jgi:hypothetical protein